MANWFEQRILAGQLCFWVMSASAPGVKFGEKREVIRTGFALLFFPPNAQSNALPAHQNAQFRRNLVGQG